MIAKIETFSGDSEKQYPWVNAVSVYRPETKNIPFHLNRYALLWLFTLAAMPVSAQSLRMSTSLNVSLMKPTLVAAVQPAAKPISLVEAYELALKEDPTYVGALASYEAALERLPQAKAALRPNFRLTGSVQRQAGSSRTNNLLGANQSVVSVSDSNSIFDGTTASNSDITSLGETVNTVSNSSVNRENNSSSSATQSVQTASADRLNLKSSGWTAQGSLDMSWAIYNSAASRNLEQSATLVEQAELQLESVRQNVALRVSQSYLEVVVAGENLLALEGRKKALAQQLETAKASYENGVVSVADFREAQAVWDAVKAQEIAQKNTLTVKKSTLQTLVGVPTVVVQPLNVGEIIDRFELSGGLEHWVGLARDQALPVRIETLGLAAAKKEIEKRRSVYKPTVEIVANLGSTRQRQQARGTASFNEQQTVAGSGNTDSSSTSNDTTTTDTKTPFGDNAGDPINTVTSSTSSGVTTLNESSDTATTTSDRRSRSTSQKWDAYIGVQVSIPLYDGGLTSSRVREALALENRKAADLSKVRKDAGLLAETEFHSSSSYLAQARALKAAERSGEVALEASQLGYEVGFRISADVLNAQQQLFAVRSDLTRVLADALLSSLRLRASIGDAGPAAISDIQRWLR